MKTSFGLAKVTFSYSRFCIVLMCTLHFHMLLSKCTLDTCASKNVTWKKLPRTELLFPSSISALSAGPCFLRTLLSSHFQSAERWKLRPIGKTTLFIINTHKFPSRLRLLSVCCVNSFSIAVEVWRNFPSPSANSWCALSICSTQQCNDKMLPTKCGSNLFSLLTPVV